MNSFECISRIEDDKARLLKERTSWVAQLQNLQAKLAEIKNKIRTSGRMEPSAYRKLCESQTCCIKEMNAVNEKVREIKDQLRDLDAEARHFKKEAQIEDDAGSENIAPTIRELANLRAEYQMFSADFTRVSSMRAMAAEFALKIDRIIKKACAPQ